jgi:hypothetical protein
MKLVADTPPEAAHPFPERLGARLGRRSRYLWWTLVLSALLSVFNLVYVIAAPPVDADSYEYAALARSYMRSGELVAHDVHDHFSNAPLPNPAWNRASLWTFILMPFERLFDYSYLSFVVPHTVTYFLVGPTTYAVGATLVPAPAAFAAAVAVMTNPRIVYYATQEDPGLPDTLTMTLFLVALYALLRQRWLVAGIISGVTLLTRLTGLIFIPLVAVWVGLFNPKQLRKRGIWMYAATTLLVGSAFFARSAMVSHNPLYSIEEERFGSTRGSSHGALDLLDSYNALKIMFAPYDGDRSAAAKVPDAGLAERARIIWKMTRVVLFGIHSQVAWYPGILETITYLLVPFCVYGLWRARKNQSIALLALFIVMYVAGIATTKLNWEDRYIFPIIPMAMLFAFGAVERVRRRVPWINARSMLVLYLAMEALPQYALMMTRVPDRRDRDRFVELTTICQWGRREFEPDAVLMPIPFWSPQYYCDRDTVPPVYGDMKQWRRIVDRYGVKYFLFSDYWGGDRPPRFSFLHPLLRGKYFTLYKIDTSDPGYEDIDARYPGMADFNYLRYFWDGHFEFEANPTTYYSLQKVTGSSAWAVVVYLGMVAFSLWAARQAWWIQGPGLFGILVLSCLLRALTLAPIGNTVMLTPPSISLRQLERVWGARQADSHASLAVVADNDGIMREIAQTHIAARRVDALSLPNSVPAVLYPVAESSVFLNSGAAIATSLRLVKEENQRFAAVEAGLQARQYTPYSIAGGVVGIRSANP